MSSPKLCSICSSLGLQRHDFERPSFEPEGRYNSTVLTGTLGYLRSNKHTCSLCRLILHTLHMNEGQLVSEQNDETEWEMTWRQHNDQYDPDADGIEDLYGSGLYPRLKTEDAHTDHCIQLVDEASTDGFLRGRMIPETISAEMVKGWMQRCETLHGEHCVSSYLHIGPSPVLTIEFIMIDVAKKCLVSLPSEAKYVALSYVWGQANHLTTVKSNLSDFKTEGAFSRTKPPRTIQDAIDLTQALGFQYLWVDALCIVQDEGEDKQFLISNMDTVYGMAALTIVAASGPYADAGLQGWKSCPSERALVAEEIGPGCRVGVLHAYESKLMDTPHARRAWTHQEGCLSRRCLVILDGKAFFSCRASIWREDVMAEIDGVEPMEGANTLGRTASPWALRRYSQTVVAYTIRQLTYQSDILNAFTGIAKAMASSMAHTRMFYALPAVAFDWAIFWTGRLKSTKLERYSEMPSWAWVGWKGEIMMAGDVYSSFDHKWLLKRTWIEWYITLKDEGTVLIWDPDRDVTDISTLANEPDSTSDHSQKVEDTTQQGEESANDNRAERHDAEVEKHEEKSNEDDELDNKDEDEEEVEEEEEEDSCPTYGTPSPNNPYGRIIHPKLLATLPERPDSTQLVPPRQSYSSPGTLIFSTVVANFRLDATSSSTTRGSIFKLRDSADRVCGFIWEDSERTLLTNQKQKVREILLLSQASPGSLSVMKSEDVGFAEQYRERNIEGDAPESTANEVDLEGENILGERHYWDFFNVMLPVRIDRDKKSNDEKPAVYEREGIGLLHKNGLAHALDGKPVWKMINLM